MTPHWQMRDLRTGQVYVVLSGGWEASHLLVYPVDGPFPCVPLVVERVSMERLGWVEEEATPCAPSI